jgi:hypothetical protein
MKNKKWYLFIIFFLINISVYSQVSVTGTAYTEIVPLATAKETVQLNFGRFSPDAGGGSITISYDGIRVATGLVTLLDGPFSQGTFAVSGSENNSLSVILPVTLQLLYHNKSINTVYLDKWTFNIPETTTGSRLVYIGATLNFRSLEINPAGFYSGTYQVIFFYN